MFIIKEIDINYFEASNKPPNFATENNYRQDYEKTVYSIINVANVAHIDINTYSMPIYRN